MSELKSKIEETTANLGMPCGMGIPMQDWAIDEIISLVKAEIVEAVEKNTTRLSIYEKEDGIYEDEYGSYLEYRLVIKAIQEVK